ncbi:MAG: antitoxin Xre/MbcA/ParS toxin-binding domain-containing protein [Aestuariivirga sp.]
MNIHAAIPAPLGYAALEKGLSAGRVSELIRRGELRQDDVYRVIPERTFKRRVAAKSKLKLEEADAIARILRVQALARWAFGETGLAAEFLDLSNPALGNRLPRVMARTDAGAREVEALLFRFAMGDPA